jgi:predicted RNA-binding protein YlxR (DUF448 family)
LCEPVNVVTQLEQQPALPAPARKRRKQDRASAPVAQGALATPPGSDGAPAGSPPARAGVGGVGKKRRGARGPRPKHVPQRTCVACRQVAGKRQLVRVVRTPAGTVEVDPTGKKNGRGAYLHADPACWSTALKRKLLQHALKTELTEADHAALAAFRATLVPADVSDERKKVTDNE